MPDIPANAGGVVVSHLERVQDLQGLVWEQPQVEAHLRQRSEPAFTDVSSLAVERNVQLQRAACLQVVARVAAAIRLRGRIGKMEGEQAPWRLIRSGGFARASTRQG